MGDVNSDGTVDQSDVTSLSRFVKGWESDAYTLTNREAADIDRDGQIRNDDVTLLARAVAGWNTPVDYAAKYLIEIRKLSIVKEPVDVEMAAQSAVLSITVSGYRKCRLLGGIFFFKDRVFCMLRCARFLSDSVIRRESAPSSRLRELREPCGYEVFKRL